MSKKTNDALKQLVLQEVRKVLTENVDKESKFIDIQEKKNAK